VTAVWTCPVCQRKVPDRVPECYCGVRREQALQHAQAEEVKARAQKFNPWPMVAVAIAIVVAGAVVVFREANRLKLATPPATPFPAIVAATATPASPPQAAPLPPALPPPRPAVVEDRSREPSSPAPSPSAEVVSPVEAARSRGAAAFQIAAAGIAKQTEDLGSRVRDYSAQCSATAQQMTPTVGCDTERRALEGELARITRALDAADDAARQAWLDPGSRRQIRDRLQVDDRIAELRRLVAYVSGSQP
jgi:hypothetical protein